MDGWQTVGDGRSSMSGWSSSLPALILVVVVMLVCSAVWAFLQRPKHLTASNPDHAVPQTVVPAPAVAQPIVPVSQPQQTIPGVAETRQPVAPAVPTEQPAAPGPTVALVQHAEATAATPLTVPAVRLQTADAPATAPGPVHVEITAAEPVWLRVTSDGKIAFTGMLAANQTRTVDANENVLLRLGSAGSVAIALNGKPIGPVGPKGQVRNVQLTSGGFQIVAAPSSAPLDPL
jgi:cytoskeletal protein RodZ